MISHKHESNQQIISALNFCNLISLQKCKSTIDLTQLCNMPIQPLKRSKIKSKFQKTSTSKIKKTTKQQQSYKQSFLVEPNISKININTDVLDMFQSQVQNTHTHIHYNNSINKKQNNQIYDIKDMIDMLAVGKAKYYPKTNNNIGNQYHQQRKQHYYPKNQYNFQNRNYNQKDQYNNESNKHNNKNNKYNNDNNKYNNESNKLNNESNKHNNESNKHNYEINQHYKQKNKEYLQIQNKKQEDGKQTAPNSSQNNTILQFSAIRPQNNLNKQKSKQKSPRLQTLKHHKATRKSNIDQDSIAIDLQYVYPKNKINNKFTHGQFINDDFLQESNVDWESGRETCQLPQSKLDQLMQVEDNKYKQMILKTYFKHQN